MKKSGLSVRLLTANLAVIVFMSITFFIASTIILYSIEKDANQTAENSAIFMQNALDDSWERIYNYSFQIINSSAVRRIYRSNLDGEDIAQNTYANSLSQEFRYCSMSNAMIEDLYLYFPLNDVMIGSRGIYSSHIYWASLYGANRGIGEEQWMANLFYDNDPGYFTVRNGTQIDLYYRIISTRTNGPILIAKINPTELKKTLNWICTDNERSFLALIDENNMIYAFSGNYERFASQETNQLNNVLPSDCLSTKFDSDIMPLTYLTITEKSTAYKTASNIRVIATVSLLVAILFSFMMSITLVRRNVRPIRKIVEKLHDGETPGGNEISLIDHQIDNLLEENRHTVDSLVAQQNMMIRRTFLSEALKFGNTYQRDIEVIAAFYQQKFENEKYVVVIRERAGQDNSTSILAYLEEVSEKDSILCWTQIQDLDVFMLNYDDVPRGQQDDLALLLQMLKQSSSPTSSFVQSKLAAHLEQIRNCYLECLQALDRLELVLASTASNLKKGWKDSERGALLGVFQNYIYDEDYLSARSMLPELCGIMFDMPNTALDFTESKYYLLPYLKMKEYVAPQEMIQAFVNGQTAAEVEKKLYDILTQMDLQMRSDSASGNTAEIAGKARQIIDDNYSNPMMGLCMIAEELNFSQSYISRVFKERYGIGVSQYISQVRVSYAKKLILEGGDNTKEIALRVGFSGERQFFRVFKKMEDTTPGDYRIQHDNKNE